ncbi:MAG: cold-shock protein [SAR324 cluster bacterium]|nr:cold-shock protein [SAR324 cluster bacterium]MBF0350368.1 cold-shock protein [SAR324 cluster bacterium]
MMQGTVKWFNSQKGYGFIQQDAGGEDLFVHHTALNGGQIKDGDKVSYDVGQGKKGPCAENVKRS